VSKWIDHRGHREHGGGETGVEVVSFLRRHSTPSPLTPVKKEITLRPSVLEPHLSIQTVNMRMASQRRDGTRYAGESKIRNCAAVQAWLSFARSFLNMLKKEGCFFNKTDEV
jgi:hypothetical protein